ncbi:hypothetical protein GCM10025789_26190 [Tessaracoccus lubricantis]|uniref:DUF1707 domain-containing protein n=1 Tax=Tessaracoccus lubricantis TaxID=545543 RepID=A0ABP9FJP1_9ACTN
MSAYQQFPGVTDQQRDRAVNHLQACYADRSIDEAELDRRLDLALNARDRVELNRSLVGLARIAPAVFVPQRPGQAAPAENVGAGLVHLSGLFTWFIAPAIVKSVARPGSHLWWEAGRALSFQLTAAVVAAAALVLGIVLGAEGFLFLAWLAWFGGTIWASVRAFNGQSGTGRLEPFMLARPNPPRQALR